MEVLPETVTEVVKKGRGRPRKEKIETAPTEPPKKEEDLKRKSTYWK